jgi:hypothetical protein
MKQIGEYVAVHPDGEPFLPEDEILDPRLRWMRDTLRHIKTNKHLYGNQEK